jgi:RNA polymerase sigma-70 factor (ECF subfamily)
VGISACNSAVPAAVRSANLANRIKAGDLAAESEFAEAFSRTLMPALLKRTRDPDIAQDCCQKTLLIALIKMRAGEILKPRSLKAFVKCTAANVVITHFRTERRYASLGDRVFLLHAESADSAARAIDSATTRCLLNEVLDRLTVSRDREILRRFYLLDEDKRSICLDFGLKTEHFDRVLYRAKKRVRQVLENHRDMKEMLLKCIDKRTARSVI